MVEEPTTPPEPTPEAFLDNIDQQYHKTASAFDSKNALAKGYDELFTKMGTAVQIPTNQTAPEEIAAFYNKIGRPETKEGYDSFKTSELPEGMNYDEEFEMTMRGIAHEAGISKAQMVKLVKAYNDYQIATFGQVRDENLRLVAEGEKALKENWGGEYDKNFEIAERACAELIPNEELRAQFAELVTDKGLRNNPVFAEVFLGIGKSMLDDTLPRGQQPQGPEGFVPASPNSPDMYAFGDSEECKKARAYFRAKGHVYATKD